MESDIKIAQANKMDKIEFIANKAKISAEYLELYGNYKAKLSLSILDKNAEYGKLILVTSITPTKAGEGKSTTTVGLTDGLSYIGKNVIGCLREPSLGPVFGIKGGATGGGMAQVVPMEDINLHFTGDMHAITTANNLISAILDNSIYQGNILNIDINRIIWKRCIDCNDRTLRSITIGQDKNINGVERKDGFVITVATEIMAILCLSEDLKDFEQRVNNCIVAFDNDGKAITVKDLDIGGAIAVIMKDAIKPNLVQTLEKTPILIHGGPFANIAHGCNSVIATKVALKHADFVVTEAGFGADLGAEKFFNIKCRQANLKPDAVVIVVTIRALKLHGGVKEEDLALENVQALLAGTKNLEKHIESIKKFNVPYVIAINSFELDTIDEVNSLKQWCTDNEHLVEVSDAWKYGGKGTQDLAHKVVELCEIKNDFDFLYDINESIDKKIEIIAKQIYGATDILYSEQAIKKLKEYKFNGWDNLPICMAKTPASLSDDAKLIGRPSNFNIHIRDLSISKGAGFIVVILGNIMTLPGLPKKPSAIKIGIDESGNTIGLF